MSRSRRKTPIFGICKSKRQSEKQDKRIANKTLRAAFRQALHHDPECSIPPLLREVSNVYNFASDGRHWRGNKAYPKWNEFCQEWMDDWYGPKAYAKMMRK
jgi:hypothetical protein